MLESRTCAHSLEEQPDTYILGGRGRNEEESREGRSERREKSKRRQHQVRVSSGARGSREDKMWRGDEW